ncbi:hypothetical protein, partial [Streptomyces roseolus]|uniref:hypothetical protein n=1 Tax=Streptomyces roseolus TaxID=67358 RepID=UPI00365A54EF
TAETGQRRDLPEDAPDFLNDEEPPEAGQSGPGDRDDSSPETRPGMLSLDSPGDQVRNLLRQTELGREILARMGDGPISARFEPRHADGRAGEFRRRQLSVVTFTSGNGHVRQALAYAHEALHAEALVEGNSARTRIRATDREDFVRSMVDEEVAANIRMIELAEQFRDLGYEVTTGEHAQGIERTYREAYDRGVNEASLIPFVLRDPGAALSPVEIHRFATDYAANAIRPAITELASDHGQSYADFYGKAWDSANSVEPTHIPLLDQAVTPAAADHLRRAALDAQAARLRAENSAADLARAAEALGLDREGAPSALREAASRGLEQIAPELADPATPPDRAAQLRRLDHDLRTLFDLTEQRELADLRAQQRADALADAASRVEGS